MEPEADVCIGRVEKGNKARLSVKRHVAGHQISELMKTEYKIFEMSNNPVLQISEIGCCEEKTDRLLASGAWIAPWSP